MIIQIEIYVNNEITMDQLKEIQGYIPKEIYECSLTISVILFFNLFLLKMCSFLGCYEITFANIFRVNLLCNACTDISYTIQKNQLHIYIFIGGYLIKKMDDMIHKHIIRKSLSNN